MSSKTKRFPYLFMTLLLVIAIFGTALPAVGQGSNPSPNYTTGMRKMVRGGAATVDPLTLPTFEFKFTLDTIFRYSPARDLPIQCTLFRRL